jgi:hypothetical protein
MSGTTTSGGCQKTAIRNGKVALIVIATVAVPIVISAQKASPTYTKDIAPILFANCVSCHRPGEIGPMSLTSYQETRPWVKLIRSKVASREMPPWHADPRYGKFRDDRSLTPQEIETIAAWADAGAPKGEDSDLPRVPTFVSDWQSGEPDYVVEMPFEFHVPAEGQLNAVYFWVPVPFNEDRLVETFEVRPGNRRVVHHIGVSVATLPEGGHLTQRGELILPDGTLQNDAAQLKTQERGAAGLTGQTGEPRKRTQDSDDAPLNSLVGVYVPGGGVYRRPPGIGRRIPAGKYLVFNVHYQPTGQPETDRSKIGMWFSKSSEVQEIYEQGVGEPLLTSTDRTSFYRIENSVETNGPMERGFPLIPPHAENFQVVGITPVVEPITLYAMWPHAHLRAKDMSWTLTWPDGRQQVLLSIPKYRFDWQILYTLSEPLKIPAGSTITAIVHYDNSMANKNNPDPDREVHWSESSWEEMFLPFMQYTVDSQAPVTKRPSNGGKR